MAELTSNWLDVSRSRTGADWANIVDRDFRSPTVSTIRLPETFAGPDFVKAVKKRGIIVGGGYGKLGATTFRIGHMGDHTVATVQRCLDACEEVIRG